MEHYMVQVYQRLVKTNKAFGGRNGSKIDFYLEHMKNWSCSVEAIFKALYRCEEDCKFFPSLSEIKERLDVGAAKIDVDELENARKHRLLVDQQNERLKKIKDSMGSQDDIDEIVYRWLSITSGSILHGSNMFSSIPIKSFELPALLDWDDCGSDPDKFAAEIQRKATLLGLK